MQHQCRPVLMTNFNLERMCAAQIHVYCVYLSVVYTCIITEQGVAATCNDLEKSLPFGQICVRTQVKLG